MTLLTQWVGFPRVAIVDDGNVDAVDVFYVGSDSDCDDDDTDFSFYAYFFESGTAKITTTNRLNVRQTGV